MMVLIEERLGLGGEMLILEKDSDVGENKESKWKCGANWIKECIGPILKRMKKRGIRLERRLKRQSKKYKF